mgnify:CR=1 FL=1
MCPRPHVPRLCARALGEASEAQAEAAEALGDGWGEVDEWERMLADELGVPIDELEDYIDDDIEAQVDVLEDYDIL